LAGKIDESPRRQQLSRRYQARRFDRFVKSLLHN
jgi:hypothetical protein